VRVGNRKPDLTSVSWKPPEEEGVVLRSEDRQCLSSISLAKGYLMKREQLGLAACGGYEHH
jgi:hypothetical protein